MVYGIFMCHILMAVKKHYGRPNVSKCIRNPLGTFSFSTENLKTWTDVLVSDKKLHVFIPLSLLNLKCLLMISFPKGRNETESPSEKYQLFLLSILLKVDIMNPVSVLVSINTIANGVF